MKRTKLMFLSSILGIMVAISTTGLIPTAKAECTCACTYDCSKDSCYSEFSGNSVADCLTCVAGCCAESKKVTCTATIAE